MVYSFTDSQGFERNHDGAIFAQRELDVCLAAGGGGLVHVLPYAVVGMCGHGLVKVLAC